LGACLELQQLGSQDALRGAVLADKEDEQILVRHP
jgi:hypothetical protein